VALRRVGYLQFDDKPLWQASEADYLRKSLNDLWTNLPTLLGVCMICLMISLPYILFITLDLYLPSLVIAPFTVAPAFAALLYYAGLLARGTDATPIDALRGLRQVYWRSTTLGILTASILAANQLTYHLKATIIDAEWLIVPWGIQLALLTFLGLLHIYTFALIALYDASVISSLRNAFVLSVRHPGPTFGLISLVLLLSYTLVFFGLGMVVVVPAVLAVFLANNTLILVERQWHGAKNGP
jgi:uncharacterized membrane protein YesL